ncbi:MAG: hypothetical protein BMS9Abin37_0529 [Acidobacteriota bacterium]|nr:MAG: hypothetical protein BMS9Abin37_0529 [Acidobacteriota bacterium]
MRSQALHERCVDCTTPCALSECRRIVDLPLRETRQCLERAAQRQGFEIIHSLDLSALARDHLRLKAPPLTILYLSHPVLLLQSSFTRGSPQLFHPWVVVLRPKEERTLVCVSSACLCREEAADAFSHHFARQMSKRLHGVARALGPPG